MHSIKVTPVSGVDEQWFLRLKPLAMEIGETFVTLMPSDEKLRYAFDEFTKSDFQTNPNLYPEVPNADTLQSNRQKLEKLLREIQAQEPTVAVKELYAARITEIIANVDMILAANAGDKDAFRAANEFIYDSPNPTIFTAACEWVRNDTLIDYPDVSQELRDELLGALPDARGDVSILIPSDDVFQTVKKLHFQPGGYIDQLFAGTQIPDDTIITPAIGDPITNQVIHNIGSDFKLIDSPTGMWAVLQSQRQVVRPSGFALKKGPFMGIISHEVGSHLLESTNGAGGNFKLLELGLDRYEAGNEGRAFLREQIMFDRFSDYINQPLWFPTKASWEYRVAIHVAISLATGLHGRKFAFSEIYHLLTVLFKFWTAKRGEPVDDETIRQGAWSMAVRALKGTDGNGGAYLKDIVYLEGNIRCWQAAKERPELILYGDFGKFDIANEHHVRALVALDVLPAALSRNTSS